MSKYNVFVYSIYSSLLVDGTTMPKLLSTVSSLCQSGGLYTSTAGVSISTRVDIDESLQKQFLYNIKTFKMEKANARKNCEEKK